MFYSRPRKDRLTQRGHVPSMSYLWKALKKFTEEGARVTRKIERGDAFTGWLRVKRRKLRWIVRGKLSELLRVSAPGSQSYQHRWLKLMLVPKRW